MSEEIQEIMQGLSDDLERHGWQISLNTACLINNALGYEKYAVWIPESEVIKHV